MKYAVAGNSGVQVPPLSIGSGYIYDRMSHDEIVEFLTTAFKAGLNWFDVGHYTSAVRPDEPASTTDIKFGDARVAAGIAREDYLHTEKLWWGDPRPSFAAQFAESLPRAQVDYADFAIFNPDTGIYFNQQLDREGIVQQMGELIRGGKTRFWGVNNITAHDLRVMCEFASAEGLPLPSIYQIPYSAIARREAENPELETVLRDFGMCYQTTTVLVHGILAGRPGSQAQRYLGSQPALIEKAEEVRVEFERLASSIQISPAQLAIAFCLTHPLVASVLVGSSSLTQLNENLKAIDALETYGAEKIRDLVAELPQNESERPLGEITR